MTSNHQPLSLLSVPPATLLDLDASQELRALNENEDFKPDPSFRWKAQSEGKLRVKDMETKHLFFSLRMIWNHSAPDRERVPPYRPWQLSSAASDYWKTALKELHFELMSRTNLEPYFKRVLVHIAACTAGDSREWPTDPTSPKEHE